MIRSANQVIIDRAALAHNLRLCSLQAGGRPVLAMVKADGYGHGMLECARVFAGAAAFGVAEPVEGVRLRQSGIEQKILVMAGIYSGMAAAMQASRLTPVFVDGALVEEFSRAGQASGQPIPVWLKIDAGMGRQGILPKEAEVLLRSIARAPGIVLEGILAHFPMADNPQSASNGEVLACFQGQAEAVNRDRQFPCLLSLANSGGIFNLLGAHFDLVRPGIALYGYYPDGTAGRDRVVGERLQPAMRFCSRVSQVRCVPAGHGLGYGHLYTTRRETRLAVLPLGYEDGYLRKLTNRASVLVRGCRAPVVGRISMNLTLLDVTDIPVVEVGDEAVLLGRQGDGEITADEIAGWLETISYEVLCLFGNLNDREFIN